MIKINSNGPTGPEYEKWKKKAETARDGCIAAWKTGNPIQLQPRLWKELKEIFLSTLFHDKCAYCEGKYCAGYASHVEHYRPKLEVTENRAKIQHPGYFWLSYEWYNLLLACSYCNSRHSSTVDGKKSSHPGKLNDFRVRGARISEPEPSCANWRDALLEEKPLLLNPYEDDPSEHIVFDDNGFAVGITDEGRETIAVCHLNRIELIEARKEARERVASAVNHALDLQKEDPFFGSEQAFSAWLNHFLIVRMKEWFARRGLRVVPIPMREGGHNS